MPAAFGVVALEEIAAEEPVGAAREGGAAVMELIEATDRDLPRPAAPPPELVPQAGAPAFTP